MILLVEPMIKMGPIVFCGDRFYIAVMAQVKGHVFCILL